MNRRDCSSYDSDSCALTNKLIWQVLTKQHLLLSISRRILRRKLATLWRNLSSCQSQLLPLTRMTCLSRVSQHWRTTTLTKPRHCFCRLSNRIRTLATASPPGNLGKYSANCFLVNLSGYTARPNKPSCREHGMKLLALGQHT